MEDSEREYYHQKIFLGEKTKEFLSNELGKFLLQKAQEEIDQVIDDFQYVDPHDIKVITQLQTRLRTALSVPQWLEQAISEGRQALDEYITRKEIEKEEKGEG